jgi:hypothetical protein
LSGTRNAGHLGDSATHRTDGYVDALLLDMARGGRRNTMIRGEDSDDKCNNVRLIRLMKRWSLSIHPSCSLTCAAEHRVGMKPDMSRGMPNWDSTVING